MNFTAHIGPLKFLNLASPLLCKGRFSFMMGASQRHQTYLTLSTMVVLSPKHFQECMNYVELGQPCDSMQKLFQPSLPYFERGERSMHNSMCMRAIVGEESDHVKQVSFSDFTYSFTMFMQAMNPRRIHVSCKSHGKHWATKISEFGHSLEVQR